MHGVDQSTPETESFPIPWISKHDIGTKTKFEWT